VGGPRRSSSVAESSRLARSALAGALALAAASFSSPARAQSIRDAVGGHLDQNLENRPKKKRNRPRHRHRAPAAPMPSPTAQSTAAPAPEPEPQPSGPDLPVRVIGKNLKLDPSIGIGYRGWQPQQYHSLSVRTENALTWQLELKAQFFGLLTLHRGYYESNAVNGPRHEGATIAAEIGGKAPKAVWVLGVLGVPIKWVLEPLIRYESRAFESTATPRNGRLVRIIPHSADARAPLDAFPETNARLRMVSSYETFVVGLRYNHDNDPSGIIGAKPGSIPPLYFGVGYTRFAKPYQVTVGDAVFDEAVFDGRFEGLGLALGLDTNQKPERFYANVATQFGLGRVKLTQNYVLNDDLPENWAIGYVQGNVAVGYIHPVLITMPTPLVGLEASAGGATFFYFKTVRQEGEPLETPPLNWDLLWAVRAYFTLPL
jgi:hypothetical protein